MGGRYRSHVDRRTVRGGGRPAAATKRMIGFGNHPLDGNPRKRPPRSSGHVCNGQAQAEGLPHAFLRCGSRARMDGTPVARPQDPKQLTDRCGESRPLRCCRAPRDCWVGISGRGSRSTVLTHVLAATPAGAVSHPAFGRRSQCLAQRGSAVIAMSARQSNGAAGLLPGS